MSDYANTLRKMSADGQGYFSEADRVRLINAADYMERQQGRLFDALKEWSKETADLRKALRAAREANIDLLSSLVAAHSLLSRGGKNAAASDKMFNQMLDDYAASSDRGRKALTAIDAVLSETKEIKDA